MEGVVPDVVVDVANIDVHPAAAVEPRPERPSVRKQGSMRGTRASKVQDLAQNVGEAITDVLGYNGQENGDQFGARVSIPLQSALKPKLKMLEERDVMYEKELEKREKRGSGIEEISGKGFEEEGVKVITLHGKDKLMIGAVFVVAISVVIALIIWSKNDLLGEDHIGHVHTTKTRVGHIHAPIFTAPVSIALTSGSGTSVFDVRLIAMATADFAHASHRRLGTGALWDLGTRLRPRSVRMSGLVKSSRRLAGGAGGATGSITYRLLADGTEFFSKTVQLAQDREVEHFETVEVPDASQGKSDYQMVVTAARSDGQSVAFMAQVIRMNGAGRYRFIIGLCIFLVTFTSIIAEKIHRSYSAFIGASGTLCALAAIQETPHLHTITGMIDYGTLMLLFSMMILMQLLAMTGFFNWAALKVIKLSKENPTTLFFLLTNICGFASMMLDNVTCVLLTGPLTYQVSKQLKLNPRVYYLSMTICATIGGTGTMIGDPPNIVIGSKLELGFTPFLKWNLPFVALVCMPVSSGMLYFRFKNSLRLYGKDEAAPKLDMYQLQKENRITDEPMFAIVGVYLFAITVALLLYPLHEIEPAWFTFMAMMGCALIFDHHHFGRFLEFVEWDTLFFFALLFVMVESLSELGVIRKLGDGLVDLIKAFPEDSRMYFAIIIILWVSGIGSAFLESLPYTTTIVYIILDLLNGGDIPGVNIPTLCWPLSVGACIGGIGSIMGSSANLVCMAISGRYAENEEEKVKGTDFLKYGLPVLVVLLVLATVWQLFLFIWLDIDPSS